MADAAPRKKSRLAALPLSERFKQQRRAFASRRFSVYDRKKGYMPGSYRLAVPGQRGPENFPHAYRALRGMDVSDIADAYHGLDPPARFPRIFPSLFNRRIYVPKHVDQSDYMKMTRGDLVPYQDDDMEALAAGEDAMPHPGRHAYDRPWHQGGFVGLQIDPHRHRGMLPYRVHMFDDPRRLRFRSLRAVKHRDRPFLVRGRSHYDIEAEPTYHPERGFDPIVDHLPAKSIRGMPIPNPGRVRGPRFPFGSPQQRLLEHRWGRGGSISARYMARNMVSMPSGGPMFMARGEQNRFDDRED
jgi:hypothetical protein